MIVQIYLMDLNLAVVFIITILGNIVAIYVGRADTSQIHVFLNSQLYL